MSISFDQSVAIRMENVSKRYRLRAGQGGVRGLVSSWTSRLLKRKDSNCEQEEFWALRDVGFQVRRGEALGLVGHNGAGKTTILKLLAGITWPTSGRVMTDGRLSSLIELGAGFHEDLTGRENIYLNGVILGLTQRQVKDRFDEIVAFSEVEDFLDTPIKRYSSGMKVRLGFAVAVHTDPEILLVDEVLAVGDLSFQRKCTNKIHELRLKHGCTIVFVSHRPWAINAVCDRAMLLVNGQITAEGNPRQVIATYEQSLRDREIRRLVKGTENITEKPDLGALADDGAGKFAITRVQLLDAMGHERAEFEGGETVTIRVHYNALTRLEHLNVELHVVRSDGLKCSVSRSADVGVSFACSSGHGYLDAEMLELQLHSGVYTLHVAVTDDPPLVAYATSTLVPFEVKTPVFNPGSHAGVYFPRVNWHQPTTLREQVTPIN